jgi:acetoin utilization deacetylase AcuC-like enzyme
LDEWLPSLLERHEPKLVFFQAGVDALKEDSFGRLGMTREGMMARNLRVYQCARRSPRPRSPLLCRHLISRVLSPTASPSLHCVLSPSPKRPMCPSCSPDSLGGAACSACMERRVPLVVTMGGGYSRPMDASVRAHTDVFRSAVQVFAAAQRTSAADTQ